MAVQPAPPAPAPQPAPSVPPAEPVTPFVYEVVDPTTPTTTALDYLLGAFAVVGAVAAAAIVLGLVFAGTLIAVRRARGTALTGAGSASLRLGLDARLPPAPPDAAPPEGDFPTAGPDRNAGPD